MAKFTLTPFDTQTAPPIVLESEFNTNGESLFISYKLTGDLASLDLGTGHPRHLRVFELWKKTCLELFIKNANGHYLEFNFSPDFEWNCFYFPEKGLPPTPYLPMDAVELDVLLSLETFHLIAELEKKKFPPNFFTGELSLGVTSVLREKNGRLSYWALSHPDTRPNFHHFESFKYKF